MAQHDISADLHDLYQKPGDRGNDPYAQKVSDDGISVLRKLQKGKNNREAQGGNQCLEGFLEIFKMGPYSLSGGCLQHVKMSQQKYNNDVKQEPEDNGPQDQCGGMIGPAERIQFLEHFLGYLHDPQLIAPFGEWIHEPKQGRRRYQGLCLI